jgi:hypothetical protein
MGLEHLEKAVRLIVMGTFFRQFPAFLFDFDILGTMGSENENEAISLEYIVRFVDSCPFTGVIEF